MSFLFSFSKKVALCSAPEPNGIIIGAASIDHLQNHFLPGSIGINHHMHYYIKPSNTRSAHTTVTQIACVDYRFVISLFFVCIKIKFSFFLDYI